MSKDAVSARVFNRVVELHCARWQSQSVEAVRALLVRSERPVDVARQLGMTPQHVTVLRARFLTKMAVKVPATTFMQAVLPDGDGVFDPFKKDIRRLAKGGYTPQQIGAYLRKNGVRFKIGALNTYLGAMNENSHTSQSKGRRR